MRLENKVAFITGAGAGIGKETALLFAREGARVVATDLNDKAVQDVVDQIKKNGGQAIAIKHDVSDEQQWIDAVKTATQTFGTIDILFNNAGIYIIKSLLEITVEEWNKLMGINVTGVFLGMKHVVPVMKKQKRGSIINAASIASIVGAPGHSLYGASKGAVSKMSKDAAMEFARDNIRINTVHPGYIRTEMVEYASKTTGKTLEELASAYPLGRLGEVRDVANAVLYLASDESAYSTASEIVVDGGVTRGNI